MAAEAAVRVEHLSHAYGTRQALADVNLEVASGEAFALLGPNGGGKTTLFKILSTAQVIQEGRATIFGNDVKTEPDRVRQLIGVVFQNPSLDKKLTVLENLRYHGQLYGLHGSTLDERVRDLMGRLAIDDRGASRVETLSGGLARRVELARALLHKPRLLILDEPSVGLDPGARRDLWLYLDRLREKEGVTILVTTHLVDEADRCNRVLILNEGKVVALGTPEALKDEIGGDVISISAKDPVKLGALIQEKFGIQATRIDGRLRVEREQGHAFIAQVVEAYSDMIDAVSLSKPTLEDVFIARTGHRFWQDGTAGS